MNAQQKVKPHNQLNHQEHAAILKKWVEYAMIWHALHAVVDERNKLKQSEELFW